MLEGIAFGTPETFLKAKVRTLDFLVFLSWVHVHALLCNQTGSRTNLLCLTRSGGVGGVNGAGDTSAYYQDEHSCLPRLCGQTYGSLNHYQKKIGYVDGGAWQPTTILNVVDRWLLPGSNIPYASSLAKLSVDHLLFSLFASTKKSDA
jgi:hypothetical protein